MAVSDDATKAPKVTFGMLDAVCKLLRPSLHGMFAMQAVRGNQVT